jgi:hypothetical protein
MREVNFFRKKGFYKIKVLNKEEVLTEILYQ